MIRRFGRENMILPTFATPNVFLNRLGSFLSGFAHDASLMDDFVRLLRPFYDDREGPAPSSSDVVKMPPSDSVPSAPLRNARIVLLQDDEESQYRSVWVYNLGNWWSVSDVYWRRQRA